MPPHRRNVNTVFQSYALFPFLGASTQVMLRLAAGISVQALMQNDGERPDLAQGTPVHCYLLPDALRVLAGLAAGSSGARGRAAGGELGFQTARFSRLP